MSHIPEAGNVQQAPNLDRLAPIDVSRLNTLIAKARSARPLTKGEKIATAEAFAPMTADAIISSTGRAFDEGARAFHSEHSLSANPYSSNDRPLEWESWHEGYEHARAGLETDA